MQIKTSHNLVKLVRPNLGTHKPRESLTSTFRELFRDFPATSTTTSSGAAGNSTLGVPRVNSKPPPYRNPPPPVSKTSSLKRPPKQVGSYDEIEIDTSQTVGDGVPHKKSAQTGWREKDKRNSVGGGGGVNSVNNGTLPRKAPPNNYVIFKTISEIRTKAEVTATQDEGLVPARDVAQKPEYSGDRFQNIPVKPRKSGGAMQRLENYCLFDPSVDFISEKDDPERLSYGGSVCSEPGLRNYETIEPGPSNFIVETDLYILDSLTDAMYGQSIGLSGLDKETPSPRSSSGTITPVAVASSVPTAMMQGQIVTGSNDRYIQVISHRELCNHALG